MSELTPTHVLDEIFPYQIQEEVIGDLKDKPLRAHSFFGPSGVGKSRFLYALLREAIDCGRKFIFFSKMAPMIRAIRDNEFQRLPEERWHEVVTPDDLNNCTSEPMHIFIDEFDKVPFTDDVYLKIFELIDFIYENQDRARLTIASNLSQDNFTAIWGEAVLRRITMITNVHNLWR